MEAVWIDSAPLHFSINPNMTQRGGYLAVIALSIGDASWNLRFQVKGIKGEHTTASLDCVRRAIAFGRPSSS
jgi:hypothetical protein